MIVELVRVIMVALFALAGWEIAVRLTHQGSGPLVLGIVLGSGVGYVLGGVFGR